MHRRSILKMFAVIPASLLAQEAPKYPANVTFRENGKTRHFNGISFRTNTSGDFWLYTKLPHDAYDNESRENIPIANIKSIETPSGAKNPQPPFPVTVTLKNNEVRKGWAFVWQLSLAEWKGRLPGGLSIGLSEVTMIVYAE
jgi:hypothetical protein